MTRPCTAYETIGADVLAPNTYKASVGVFGWLKSLFVPATAHVSIPKHKASDAPKDAVELASALQYGQATGLPALTRFVKEFSALVYDPAFADFETLVNCGATHAWSMIAPMLCERGDGVLCEEWTYPSALASCAPYGIRPIPIKMDGEGMTAESMREILANWNVYERGGMKRPSVLYTIPVCQNPTGATMSDERKKAIYQVAVDFDVIVVEDSPYHFTSTEPYSVPSARPPYPNESDDDWLAGLPTSFLRFDHQGRVIRIDTFSKTLCPGSRLGWTTASPLFTERLLRAAETSTQAPCGFGQALVTKLLCEHWGMKGYLRWLKGIKYQYRMRRDMAVDLLLEQSHTSLEARSAANNTWELKVANRDSEKSFSTPTLLSFVAPEGGMFVWLRVHLSSFPSYRPGQSKAMLAALWEDLAKNKVLVVPGTYFAGGTMMAQGDDDLSFNQDDMLFTSEGDGFFRLAFSTASQEDMATSMRVIAQTTRKFYDSA